LPEASAKEQEFARMKALIEKQAKELELKES